MTLQSRRFLLGVSVAVLVAIVSLVGLYLAGSPGEARLRRLDERRAEDLGAAKRAIDGYWSRRGALPASLDSLSQLSDGGSGLRDPLTRRMYSYTPTGDSTYDLCADFARASDPVRYASPYDMWQHPAGRYCFHVMARRVP